MIIVAYAKALEKLTGADVDRILRIPDVDKKKFPEAAKCKTRHYTPSCFVGVRKITASWKDLERPASERRAGTRCGRRHTGARTLAGVQRGGAAAFARKHRSPKIPMVFGGVSHMKFV